MADYFTDGEDRDVCTKCKSYFFIEDRRFVVEVSGKQIPDCLCKECFQDLLEFYGLSEEELLAPF